MTVAQVERFSSRFVINPNTGCWDWLSYKDKDGYGRYSSYYAHKILYQLIYGLIPSSKVCDHVCRNRACVNPKHIEIVTIAENVKRGLWGNRTHCSKGHKYTSDNTYVRPSKPNVRRCKICKSLQKRKWYAKVQLLGQNP